MQDGSNLLISLDDRNTDPMYFSIAIGKILSIAPLTFLPDSTSLIGKSPPVRFKTYLSVTYDFLLRPAGFLFCGTWGRYFHNS